MRVIILDFDGVLHPSGGRPGTVLPFEWVPVLARLLQPWPDVRLVVHSTWRDNFTFDELREFLAPLGERLIAVVGQGQKAMAIIDFLSCNINVSCHLVLDDTSEEFPATLVICDSLTGLSANHVQVQISGWLAQSA